MKARDIIPGWPRGRSTGTFIAGRADLNLATFFCRHLPERCVALTELQHNVEYHEAQQQMQDEYFEQWRRPPVLYYYGAPVTPVRIAQ